LSYGRFL